MALLPLATVVQLEAWLGSEADAARAGAVLDAVSSLVRSEAGLTWEDTDVPADIQTVTLQVAMRVYNNPAGIAQESVGSYSVRYSDPSLAGLYLTDGEQRIVRRYRVQPRGLWTLGTTRDDVDADTTYVPIEGTDAVFPWYAGDVEV